MSKGSKLRRSTISQKQFSENWDNIFHPSPPPSKEDIAIALAVRAIGMVNRGVDKFGLSRWLGDGMLWNLHLNIRENIAEEIIKSDLQVESVKSIILSYQV